MLVPIGVLSIILKTPVGTSSIFSLKDETLSCELSEFTRSILLD